MDFVSGVRSSALGLPWSWVIAIYPLGMGLIIIHLLVRVTDDLQELAGNVVDRGRH